jgi:hypothetical protein
MLAGSLISNLVGHYLRQIFTGFLQIYLKWALSVIHEEVLRIFDILSLNFEHYIYLKSRYPGNKTLS